MGAPSSAADQLQADIATVVASWPDIWLEAAASLRGLRCACNRADRGYLTAWTSGGVAAADSVPSTLPRNPGWLEPLRQTLCNADTAILFPLLDRGEGMPDWAIHQALLHDVLHGLCIGHVSMPSLTTGTRCAAQPPG